MATVFASSGFEGTTVGANEPRSGAYAFNAGSLSGSGTATFDSAHPHGGSRTLKLATAVATDAVFEHIEPASGMPTIVGRGYLYFAALPPNTLTIMSAYSGATKVADVRLSAGGTLSVRNVSTAIGTATLVAARMYRIEWMISPNPTGGTQTLRVFSGTNLESSASWDASVTGAASATAATSINSLRYTISGDVFTVWWDDVAAADDWIGPAGSNPADAAATATASAVASMSRTSAIGAASAITATADGDIFKANSGATIIASSNFNAGTTGATVPHDGTDCFNDGSDTGGGTSTYVTTNTHAGSARAMLMQTPAATDGTFRHVASGTPRGILAMRGYFTWPALPPSNYVPFVCYLGDPAGTGVRVASIRLSSSGTLTIRNVDTGVASATATIVPGRIYRLEWYIDPDPTTGVQRLRIASGGNLDSVGTLDEPELSGACTGSGQTTADRIHMSLNGIISSVAVDDYAVGYGDWIGPSIAGKAIAAPAQATASAVATVGRRQTIGAAAAATATAAAAAAVSNVSGVVDWRTKPVKAWTGAAWTTKPSKIWSADIPDTYDATATYAAGSTTIYGGRVWQATQTVLPGCGPLGTGDGSATDQAILVARAKGFAKWVTGGQGKAIYTVANANDSGAGSLRQALLDAKANDGGWIIFNKAFNGGVYNITLQSKVTLIQRNLTVDGRGVTVHIDLGGTPGGVGVGTFGNTWEIGSDNYSTWSAGGNTIIASNLIFENLNFDSNFGGDDSNTGTNDAITHRMWTRGVFWEHCQFSNPDPNTDGLFDVSYGATEVHSSWCNWFRHHKMNLIWSNPIPGGPNGNFPPGVDPLNPAPYKRTLMGHLGDQYGVLCEVSADHSIWEEAGDRSPRVASAGAHFHSWDCWVVNFGTVSGSPGPCFTGVRGSTTQIAGRIPNTGAGTQYADADPTLTYHAQGLNENCVYTSAVGATGPALQGIKSLYSPPGQNKYAGLLLENGATAQQNEPTLVFVPTYPYSLEVADAQLKQKLRANARPQPGLWADLGAAPGSGVTVGWVAKPAKAQVFVPQGSGPYAIGGSARGTASALAVATVVGGQQPASIYFGSSYQGNGLTGWQSDLDPKLVAAINGGATYTEPPWLMQSRRTYSSGGVPTSFNSTPASGDIAMGNGVVSVPSIKTNEGSTGSGLMAAGNYDTAVQTYIQSFPTGTGHKWYLCWEHEADQPSKGVTPLNFRAGFARFAKLVKKYRGTRDITPFFCLMAQTVRGTTYDSWDPKDELAAPSVPTYTGTNAGTLPGMTQAEVLATQDGYLHDSYSSPATTFGSFTKMIGAGWTRFAIPELGVDQFGYQSTTAEARQWLTDVIAMCRGIAGMEFVCYFCSKVGSDNPTYGWYFYDDTGLSSCAGIWGQACRDG